MSNCRVLTDLDVARGLVEAQKHLHLRQCAARRRADDAKTADFDKALEILDGPTDSRQANVVVTVLRAFESHNG
jgi:hypothetical protein